MLSANNKTRTIQSVLPHALADVELGNAPSQAFLDECQRRPELTKADCDTLFTPRLQRPAKVNINIELQLIPELNTYAKGTLASANDKLLRSRLT